MSAIYFNQPSPCGVGREYLNVSIKLITKGRKNYQLFKKRISFVVLRSGTVYNAHTKLAKIWSIEC